MTRGGAKYELSIILSTTRFERMGALVHPAVSLMYVALRIGIKTLARSLPTHPVLKPVPLQSLLTSELRRSATDGTDDGQCVRV